MDYVEKIKRSGVKIIRGYASSMYLLAKYMKKFDVKDINIDAVMTTGEILFPHYRKLIESQFGCKVFDGYGGESIVVAFECEKHNGYHVCDEDVVLEFLRRNENIATEKTGELVLTSLSNYAMPFIRYRISDIGKKSSGRCGCGRGLSMIDSIQGRDTDIVIAPDGNSLVVHFFTILFEYLDGVDQFQVIQKKIDKLVVKIVKNDKFSKKDSEHIKNEIKKKMGDSVEIEIEIVDNIPLSKSGKRRFVISNISSKKFDKIISG
jgi:phenylacetate-CoA ligase